MITAAEARTIAQSQLQDIETLSQLWLAEADALIRWGMTLGQFELEFPMPHTPVALRNLVGEKLKALGYVLEAIAPGVVGYRIRWIGQEPALPPPMTRTSPH